MKIAIIITNPDRAGAQMHVLSLLDGLNSKHEFLVIVGAEGFLTVEARKLGINCHIIHSLNRSISPWQDYLSFISIQSLIKTFSPDLVHVHSAKAAVLGRLAAKTTSTKSIYTVHGWAFSEGNAFLKTKVALLVEKMMAKFTDKFIVVSHYDKNIAINRITTPNNMVVVHNGIPEINEHYDQCDKSTKPLKLICVARLSRQKNIPCLLRAIAMIDSSAHLDIVGSGPDEKKIKHYASKLGVNDKVSFLGERSDINQLLESSDIFLLSSDWEGLPIAIIEATRAYLPIISTDVGGVREIVENGVNGYLIVRNDAKSFARKLTQLINDEDKRNHFSQESRKRYEEYFKLEPMLQKTNEIYHQVAVSAQ